MPVDPSHITLHVLIVAAEERGHARRVAGATRILQERGVIQRRHHFAVEVKLTSETHGDQRRPEGVAGALSFGKVERICQR